MRGGIFIASIAVVGAGVYAYFRLKGEPIASLFTNTDSAQRIAQAIALAEGYNSPGSRPNRNNNPGDLTGNYAGTAIASDSIFDVYANATDGWNALYRQVGLWLTNSSSVANRDTTIAELAQSYTTTDQASWAAHVASALGVNVDTPLSEV